MYTIGGVLYHSAKGTEWKNKKYVDKVRTKSGKWRYIYSSAGSSIRSGARNLKKKASYSITGSGYKSDAVRAMGEGNTKVAKAMMDNYKKNSLKGKMESSSERVQSAIERLKEKWNSSVDNFEKDRLDKKQEKMNTSTATTKKPEGTKYYMVEGSDGKMHAVPQSQVGSQKEAQDAYSMYEKLGQNKKKKKK